MLNYGALPLLKRSRLWANPPHKPRLTLFAAIRAAALSLHSFAPILEKKDSLGNDLYPGLK